MSETMELARLRIKPLMRKEAKGKKILNTLDRWVFGKGGKKAVGEVEDLGDSTKAVKKELGPEKSEALGDTGSAWTHQGVSPSRKLQAAGMTTGVGIAAGTPEYYRQQHNAEQRAIIENVRQDKKLFKPKGQDGSGGFTIKDLEEALAGKRGRGMDKVLKGRGYTGEEGFSPGRTVLRGLGGAVTGNPRYWASQFKRTSVKDLARLKKNNPKLYNKTMERLSSKGQDLMMPVLKGGATSAAMTASPEILESASGLLSAGKSYGETSKKTSSIMDKVDKMVGDSDGSIGDVVSDIGAASKNISEFTDPDKLKALVGEGFSSAFSGAVEGGKREINKISDWTKANPGLAVAGGAGAIGLFAAYKIWKDRAKRKRKEEEAQILAKALKGSRR